jgi:hypothetical protein
MKQKIGRVGHSYGPPGPPGPRNARTGQMPMVIAPVQAVHLVRAICPHVRARESSVCAPDSFREHAEVLIPVFLYFL